MGGGWEGRGRWEQPARRIDPARNTGFAHVVQEVVRKEKGAADCYKTVDSIQSGQQLCVPHFYTNKLESNM